MTGSVRSLLTFVVLVILLSGHFAHAQPPDAPRRSDQTSNGDRGEDGQRDRGPRDSGRRQRPEDDEQTAAGTMVTEEPVTEETVAQTESAEVGVGDGKVTVRVTTAMHNKFGRDRWSPLEVSARSVGEDATVTVVVWFTEDPGMQFARRIHVPAGTRRTTSLLVRAPDVQPSRTGYDMRWIVVEQSARGEQFQVDPNRERIEERTAMVPNGQPRIGVLCDFDEEQSMTAGLLLDGLRELVQGFGPLTIFPPRLSDDPLAWDLADVLIVSGNRIAVDVAAQEALRAWVQRGGSLWLTLDSLHPDTLPLLLGDMIDVTPIDRVSLQAYTIESEVVAGRPNETRVELEHPVDFLRVVVDSAGVTHRIGEWPAAFETRMGSGRIVCTTLAVPGWIIPSGWGINHPGRTSPRQVTAAMSDLRSLVIPGPTEPVIPAETWMAYLDGHVGDETPPLLLVAGMLAVFCTAVVVTGVWLRRIDSAAWLMVSLPVCSLVATGVFLVLGGAMDQSPDVMATLQFVSAQPGQQDVTITSMATLKSPTAARPEIGSVDGGMLLPDRDGSEAALWRLEWTDSGQWNLLNVTLPPRRRFATGGTIRTLDEPLKAIGTFDDSGFQLKVSGTGSDTLNDAVVASSTHVALPLSASGAGTWSGTDALPPGEYFAQSLLSSEQARRQQVLRGMLGIELRNRKYPGQPTLLAWSQPLDRQPGRLDFRGDMGGASLYAIPIQFERPAVGTKIRVPATFLPVTGVQAREHGFGFAAGFSNGLGVWTESPRGTKALLRFDLPPELLPLDVDHATFTIRITAPLRDVVLSSGQPGALVEIARESSPVGTVTIPITDPVALRTDGNGALFVALQVGDVQLKDDPDFESGTQDRYWHIHMQQLEIEGTIP